MGTQDSGEVRNGIYLTGESWKLRPVLDMAMELGYKAEQIEKGVEERYIIETDSMADAINGFNRLREVADENGVGCSMTCKGTVDELGSFAKGTNPVNYGKVDQPFGHLMRDRYGKVDQPFGHLMRDGIVNYGTVVGTVGDWLNKLRKPES